MILEQLEQIKSHTTVYRKFEKHSIENNGSICSFQMIICSNCSFLEKIC